MSTAPNLDLVSVEQYLACERAATAKHEYLGGVVYAMSGGSIRHNQIATNVLVALGGQLRGQRRRAFNSDMKVRIRLPNHVRFYYPDVSVVCRSNPPDEVFQDDPVLVVEVISNSTRRADEGEKRDAYLSIPSLTAYWMIHQDSARVVAFRRTEQGFTRELYQGLETVLPLEEIGVSLALSDVYDGIELGPVSSHSG